MTACPAPKLHKLPVLHTFKSESLAQIQATGGLVPMHCDNYNTEIVYCFYGRPAYQIKMEKNEKRPKYLPICFCLNPDLLKSNLVRVLPFDSGVAFDGKYHFAEQPVDLTPYQLPTDLEAVVSHVETFFGSNEAYVFSRIDDKIPAPNDNQYAKNYYDMFFKEEQTELDDRRFTIELQFATDISLSDCLSAVILPSGYLSDRALLDTIRNVWRATPLIYHTYNGSSLSLYHGDIRSMYFKWLKLQGYLS